MRKPQPLQKFGHQDSQYERPNQKWVCGKTVQGCPCEIGPSKKGKCRADFECKPKATSSGDQWKCTRSSNSGGTCSNGPLPDGTCCKPITPCHPTRSIRYKRSLAIKWVSILTLGILLLFMNGRFKTHFLSPGKLTYQHANNADCVDCHQAFDQDLTGWVHQAFNAVNILDNNKQCVNCHEFGDHAADAHGLSELELKNISYALESGETGPHFKQIACMTCHVEHHGENSSLLAVSSQNCALCHDLPYEKGSKAHPEFRQYPYARRTGIIFDHTEHYDKHFYDNSGENRRENAPDSCLTCHVSDNNGIKMVVRNFKRTCSECHNDKFEESETFPVITVPALDTDNITSLSNWPTDADAELTPFMKLLMISNDKAKSVLSELDGGDLTALEEEDAQAIAWSIKELFYDIYTNGETAITQRLANAFGCQLNTKGKLIQEPACHLTISQLDDLVTTFPYPLFCSAQKEWFPKLLREMRIYHDFQGKKHKIISKYFCESLISSPEEVSDTDSWTLDYFTLGYRPVSHEDHFFSTWLNTSINHQEESLNNTIHEEIFTLLNSEDTAGQCAYCHSIDTTETTRYINWSVPQWNPKRKDFVHFNHAGHLRGQEEDVCLKCHKVNKEADYQASYKNETPLEFQSNFSTEKEQCQTCHKQSMTENQCQICHNYHVSSINDKTYLNHDLMGSGVLKVWTDKTEYLIGDNISIKFSVDQSMYVRIVRIDSSGKILSLFPNDFRLDHYCKPSVIYQIPKLGSDRTLLAEAPTGSEKLLAIGSEDPISEDDLFFTKQGDFDEDKMSKYTVRALLNINVVE